MDNEPQPDAVLLIDSSCGGQSYLSDDGYIEAAPELIVEIAASSASIDLRDKKRVYCRSGVKEYLVWEVMDNRFYWFSLQDTEYISISPDDEGIIRSQVFPGLWLAVSALLERDMIEVVATLQAGLSSSEHQQFLQQLTNF